jgi:hypothetical protein
MFTANPFYYQSYTPCHCTWTICRCQTYVDQQTFWMQVLPSRKPETPIERMNRLMSIAKPPQEPKQRYRNPVIRPSIQALSMRIR